MLLLLLTFPYCIIFPVLFLVGVGFAAFDKYLWSSIYAAALIAGSWFFIEPLRTFVHTVGISHVLLHDIPLYLGVGLAVAVLKWFLFVLKTAGKIKDAKETFNPKYALSSSDLSDATKGNDDATRRAKFIEHWNGNVVGYSSTAKKIKTSSITAEQWAKPEILTDLLTPKAKQHVDDISYWIFFWPFVVVSTLFKDLVVKLAKHAARFFDWAFNRVSRLVISNAAKGI